MWSKRVTALLFICFSAHVCGFILPTEQMTDQEPEKTSNKDEMLDPLQDDVPVSPMESNQVEETVNMGDDSTKAADEYKMSANPDMMKEVPEIPVQEKDMKSSRNMHKMDLKAQVDPKYPFSRVSMTNTEQDMLTDIFYIPNVPSERLVFTTDYTHHEAASGGSNSDGKSLYSLSDEFLSKDSALGYTPSSDPVATNESSACTDNSENEGVCMMLKECAAILDYQLVDRMRDPCLMYSEEKGVCCPNIKIEKDAEHCVHYWKNCTSPLGEGRCMAFEECLVYHNTLFQDVMSPCTSKDNLEGVCCSKLANKAMNVSIPMNQEPKVNLQQDPQPLHIHSRKKRSTYLLIIDDLNAAGHFGMEYLNNLDYLEGQLLNRGIFRNFAQSFIIAHGPPPEMAALGIHREAIKIQAASSSLARTYGIYGEDLRHYSFLETILENSCPLVPYCDYQRVYRTMDGSCTHPQKNKQGMSFTPTTRILSPAYQDGVYTPRVATDGSNLPDARYIRRKIMTEEDKLQKGITLMLMQWGQFIAHDLSHTPTVKFSNGSNLRCCLTDGRRLPSEYLHPSCFPMLMQQTDYYGHPVQDCMNFVRSMIAPNLECTFDHAEQMNQVTHYLDGSTVYGSSDDDANWLRTFEGGKLRIFNDNGKEFLPLETDNGECTNFTNGLYCFRAGDKRVNEQPGLTAMHTLWMREHNRVATQLRLLNPYWKDEVIFQQARRIVIAEIQHITYTDYLTLLLGRKYMRENNLYPQQSDYSSSYDHQVDPRITNEFATAAFRMGHTQVAGTMWLVNEIRKDFGSLRLRDSFFTPDLIRRPGLMEGLLRGMTRQLAENFDNFFPNDLTELLFKNKRGERGSDLGSRNIQRGRDHGLPGYNSYRKACGQQSASTFYDFGNLIPKKTVSLLGQVYNHVDDVDLFVGGIGEVQVRDAILGPTFQCIVGDQFARTRTGDRYFYEWQGYAHSFTSAQLRELKKASLARIICDNSNIKYIQRNVFRSPSRYNAVIPCTSVAIPQVYISQWRAVPFQ